jgi:sugar/nucleoside kinase (ribokinase family)
MFIIGLGDNMKSLVIGTSSIDTLIHVGDINQIQEDMSLWADYVATTIGSTGAGKAFALDVLGTDITLITDLGNDSFKDVILDFFATTSIHLKVLQTDKSTAHTNIMHSNGKRISIFTSMPTTIPSIHPNIHTMIENTDVIFLNINEYCRNYIPIFKQYDKPILVDIHDYQEGNPYHQDFIEAADILVASGVNIPNHRQFLETYIKEGKEIVIITKGSEGLIAMDQYHNLYELPGYNEFDYVDSNGAGDAFTAGFMLEYFKTTNVLKALQFGTVCGGIACSSIELYHREYTEEKIRNILKNVSL